MNTLRVVLVVVSLLSVAISSAVEAQLAWDACLGGADDGNSCSTGCTGGICAQFQQIDSFDHCLGICNRSIPDITTGGTTLLDSDMVIDIVVLGDGYLAGEDAVLFNDAQNWYNRIFGTGVPGTGIRPYNFFAEAFRVWAVFTESAERASNTRGSYYKVSMNADNSGVASGSWYMDPGDDNDVFRSNLFGAIDGVDTNGAINFSKKYPDDLVSSPYEIADAYRNLTVAMLIRRLLDGGQAGGRAGGYPRQ